MTKKQERREWNATPYRWRDTTREDILERYPIYIHIFERTKLLHSAKKVKGFLREHPDIGNVTYLAFVEQLQTYGPKFETKPDPEYELKQGQRFSFTYHNGELRHRLLLDGNHRAIDKRGLSEPESVEQEIESGWDGKKLVESSTIEEEIAISRLYGQGYPIGINNCGLDKNGNSVFDEKGNGTVGNVIKGDLRHALLDLWDDYVTYQKVDFRGLPITLSWVKRYDHMSVATVSMPRFTKDLVAAAEDIGAKVQVYREA